MNQGIRHYVTTQAMIDGGCCRKSEGESPGKKNHMLSAILASGAVLPRSTIFPTVYASL